MAQCARCRKRKAKRSCPALGAPLCSLCCGQLREKELHCPPGCPYLGPHQSYQEKKEAQKTRAFSEDIFKDERLAWLILNLEAPLHDFGERNPGFTDKDAILALEYAKDRMRISRSLVLTAGDDRHPRNEAGEAVFHSLRQCRFHRKIILPQSLESYTDEEKVKGLDNTISAVKHMARENVEGRTYLQDLGRRLARLRASSEPPIVITRP
ncbi:MAG: hypothetical protein JXE07_02825 [Candidatus Aminicenantes bacterium]|nr:hypothetical protein [Candidatus Aminicenantes bacterium]